MRFIKKHFSWWRLLLIVGGTAIAIPIATGASPTAIAVVKERQDFLDNLATVHNEDAPAKHSKDSKVGAGPGVARVQDDYYERRREYWEKRVERRLDEEDLDDETGNDKDDADAKDSKADKDDGDDEDDQVEQEVERRREYWRKRVERDW